MKKAILFSSLIVSIFINAQSIPTYYSNVNLDLNGIPLKTELSNKITNTHTYTLTYTEVWDVLKESDLNPTDNQNVWLIYGWNDTNTDITDDLNRSKEDNGGNTGDWNREHTFAKSLGEPNLGTSGPGADAHNLRASDVQRNGSRGNKKFAASSGIASGTTGANWYPGDDWRGDVARIIMYMYLRYQNQCKPSAVTVGNPVGIDLNMVDLLLTWNAADPPGDFEDNRNQVIFEHQGNRNPFIDNPYLATLIWGGVPAVNRWNLDISISSMSELKIYPNPCVNGTIKIENIKKNSDLDIEIYNVNGQNFQNHSLHSVNGITTISNLPMGIWVIRIISLEGTINRKILVI